MRQEKKRACGGRILRAVWWTEDMLSQVMKVRWKWNLGCEVTCRNLDRHGSYFLINNVKIYTKG